MTPSRREFLLRSATATGLVAASPTAWSGLRLSSHRRGSESLPPHHPQIVPGVHVYADRESTAPGEVIQFHLSHDRPVQAEICRLGLNVEDPADDTVLHPFGTIPPQTQPIHPGSYVHVAKRLKGSLTSFTVEAWVRPWRTDRLMGVVSQEDKESSEGWALGIGKDGYVGFYLGDGVSEDDALVHRTPPGQVTRGRWHHLVARWDGAEKQVWVDGRKVSSWPFPGPLRPGPHPIRLGAMSEKAVTTRLLDGDLAMVVVRNNAISDEEIQQRHGEQGLLPSTGPAVLACWTFAEERGAQVRDISRHGRHGQIINHGTWMIGGPSFDAGIPRFADYQPAEDPRRGHGLRLLSDDLYDCGWEPSLRWKVPAGIRSGFHVLRLRWEEDGKPHFQHATFVVRRSPRRRAAPILLLAATNTWRAYNASAFGRIQPGARQICGTDGLPNAEGNPPAFSFYRGHAAGPGTYQLGSRLPWPASGPYLRYGDATDYSHLARADRFTQTWLEREGYDYEVISDLDLHRNPGQLRSHRVFLINGHSEYWSIEMYRGLEEYLGAGGRAMVLSGNSLFWRVSFNPEGTIMECRKVDAPGDQLRPEQRGEAWHSHDGQRGGMLRECGFPGWRLIGLETLGWNNQGEVRNFGPWIAEATGDPLFHEPEETGLKPGDRFGWAGPGSTPMANGHEFDVRLSTLASLAAGPVPPGSVMPQDPDGMRRLANGVIPWAHGGSAFDYFFRPIRPANEQGGEMIWWERPEGGTVFNAGSIGSGWALHADARWGRLLRNVLHRFGVQPTR
jgi:hypothetical protein